MSSCASDKSYISATKKCAICEYIREISEKDKLLDCAVQESAGLKNRVTCRCEKIPTNYKLSVSVTITF